MSTSTNHLCDTKKGSYSVNGTNQKTMSECSEEEKSDKSKSDG